MFRVLFLASLALAAAAPAVARPPPPAPVEPAPPKAKGILFTVLTGPEDPSRAMQALRMARVIQQAGSAEHVEVILAGRAAMFFLPNTNMPGEVKKEFEEAKAAGVRVAVCEHSLSRWGIPVEHAATFAEVVPKAAEEIGKLVAQGYEVISF